MSEDDELPAVYKSLSTAGLNRLRATYTARLDTAESTHVRGMLERRLHFLEAELAQREG